MKNLFIVISKKMTENPSRYSSVKKTVLESGFDCGSASGHGYYGMQALMVSVSTKAQVDQIKGLLKSKSFFAELEFKAI